MATAYGNLLGFPEEAVRGMAKKPDQPQAGFSGRKGAVETESDAAIATVLAGESPNLWAVPSGPCNDTDSDEAIAIALSRRTIPSLKHGPSSPSSVLQSHDHDDSTSTDEELELDPDGDDAALAVAERVHTVPRMSIKTLTELRVNLPASFWEDHVTEDRKRLLSRLKCYDLCEYEVCGDGNCQFRSLSDQLYRTPAQYRQVRRDIVKELRAHPDRYKPYVAGNYRGYCTALAKEGTWGDNITLQAASNVYGLRVILITSFDEEFVISIEPAQGRGGRILYLSFWAEVHYNSIYPATDPPTHPADSPDSGKPHKVLGSRRLGKQLSKLGIGAAV